MIDEYSDDLTGLDDHLNKHPQFANAKKQSQNAVPRRTPPVMYSDDFEEPVRSRAPRNQAAPVMEPRRGYRRETYTRDSQDLEDDALGSILKEQGNEMGFVRILGLALFCLVIISGSFYLSFTLGKKIFLTSFASSNNGAMSFGEYPANPHPISVTKKFLSGLFFANSMNWST
jgi:hypothetical protein